MSIKSMILSITATVFLLNSLSEAQFQVAIKSHRQSTLWTSITNWGALGNPEDQYDPEYGGLAPGAHFPGGSNLNYLWGANIWMGAATEDPDNPGVLDTLVSVGFDGWFVVNEFMPADSISRVSDYADDELITSYADTTVDGIPRDPHDQRPHIPLGVLISCHSYSWAGQPDDDFVIIEYTIKNILENDLTDVYVGFYYDGDVLHSSENPYGNEEGAQDDICGYLDEVDAAYIIDNNGQPYSGQFTEISPTGICGIKFLGSSQPDMELSFNWWISNLNPDLDWGPQLLSNYDGPFPGGGNGTPGGDVAKYRVMSNGEFDYDQVWAAFDYSDEGWIPPVDNADDLANGYDTRFLFSFGPMNISPGDSAYFHIALVAGAPLHTDPNNYEDNLRYNTDDSTAILTYLENLDFSDFLNNCQRAYDVYLGMTDIPDDSENRLPGDYSLSQNYPNPFNASTTIRYALPEEAEVTIEIYDILGRRIETLVVGKHPAGSHTVVWEAKNTPSGVYFYRIEAGEYSQTEKCVLLK
jgi:hypothetical protein